MEKKSWEKEKGKNMKKDYENPEEGKKERKKFKGVIYTNKMIN